MTWSTHNEAVTRRNHITATVEKRQFGNLAVITGASSGIGFALAAVFAKNGFDLLIAAENVGIEQAAEDFQALTAKVDFLRVDLA